jgi:PqqD family protein of HPr-rel-A system
MASITSWQLTPPAKLHWQQWDDECLFYHAASGDTHLIDPTGAQILLILQGSPKTLAELLEDLGESEDAKATQRLSGYLESLLAKLHRLGVIEPT